MSVLLIGRRSQRGDLRAGEPDPLAARLHLRQFIALGANRSSFAVFSRKFTGKSGGGDTREPVKSWVPKIREQLAR